MSLKYKMLLVNYKNKNLFVVLVSGCEFYVHAMRRLNRNRVQTNLIGQNTLKINIIFLKKKKVIYVFFF